MKRALKNIFTFLTLLTVTISASAKDPQITIQSDPEGAQVYLNDVLIATSTPAIVNLPKKVVTKNMQFRFVKDGYETKSVVVQYTKDQLKYNPVVMCTMKKLLPNVLRLPMTPRLQGISLINVLIDKMVVQQTWKLP
ncbi:MAG: PEGA domain-containing protein [Paramuribaculum sp.]|nr:PEGA domain-containing protein [Paramuribaculum sp.]